MITSDGERLGKNYFELGLSSKCYSNLERSAMTPLERFLSLNTRKSTEEWYRVSRYIARKRSAEAPNKYLH